LILFTIYIGSAIGAASAVLLDKAPEFISRGLDQFNEWLRTFKGSLPLTVAAQVETFIAGLGPSAGKFTQDFMVGSMAIIPATVPSILGFLTLPFFLFFVLMVMVLRIFNMIAESSAESGDILASSAMMGRHPLNYHISYCRRSCLPGIADPGIGTRRWQL
jgi:hypothetical protein